jgi:hypothetical protein
MVNVKKSTTPTAAIGMVRGRSPIKYDVLKSKSSSSGTSERITKKSASKHTIY